MADMSHVIVRNWWSLVIRGIIAILFGVLTFVWPGMTLDVLVIFFGAYALIDGVLSLIGAVKASSAHERWGALFFEGIVGLFAGVATLFWPALTLYALTVIIGAWAMVTGVFELIAAWRLRKQIAGEWMLALTGVASVIFGILMWIAPLAGALVLALWVGAYALIFGVLLVALGFRLRSHALPMRGSSMLGTAAH
jgi:uncharacterized membrane protein HdeD (DUF308 family)